MLSHEGHVQSNRKEQYSITETKGRLAVPELFSRGCCEWSLRITGGSHRKDVGDLFFSQK